MNLVRNILTTLSARILTLALAVVASILMARLLGPEGRGLFALVFLLPELARTLGLLGFEQANAVYAGLEPDGRRSLVWQSVAIATVVGIVIAVAGAWYVAAGTPGIPTLVRGPLWLYLLPLVTVPTGLLAAYWSAILRGMNRILLLNTVEVGAKVASLLLIVLFIGWLRLDVAGAVWADVILTIATLLLMAVLLRYTGAWGTPSFDQALWRRSRRFALPVYGAGLMGYLNYRIDQFIVAGLLPTDQLGFYVIAVGLSEKLWLLTGAVANALLPHLTNSPDRDPALAAVVSRHVLIWTGAVCLLLFALADVVITVLYSREFAPSVAPLRWLLPGTFILSVGKVVVAEIAAREKVNYLVWVAGLVALVNIAGNLSLIPIMGISGAALASSMSYSVLSFAIIWYYVRVTGVSWTILAPRKSDLLVYALLWARRRNVPASQATRTAAQP